MKKSILSKIIVLIIILGLMACMTTTVFADDGILDLNPSLNGGNNPESEVEPEPEIQPEPEPEKKPASTYEETDIPYAGPEDTILMVSAFIMFGIIGVYTFIKMSDYSNI